MPVSVRRHGGFMLASLGVAVFVVLALVVAFLLLPACGLRPLAGWLETCPPAPVAVLVALEEEAERTAALRDRIAQREREIAGLPACPPSPPQEPLPEPESRDPSQGTGSPPPQPGEPRQESEESPPESADPPEEPEETPPPPEEPPEEPEEESPSPEEPEEQSEFDERLDAEDGEVSEELTVTLIWNDRSDLDLEVHCPDGGTAGVRGTGCGGGVLDVDANGYGPGGLMMMERPVENVLFGANTPAGEYRIRIFIAESYEDNIGDDRTRNSGRHPFRVRVISHGNEQVFEDVHPGLGQGDVWLNFTHR